MIELDKGAREAIRAAIRYSFARAGGPGGQNVNKVASKAVAKLSLADLTFLPEEELQRLRTRLARRINALDELVVAAQDTRDQLRNRQIAEERVMELIHAALQRPKKRRRTFPGKGAREARLRAKRIQGQRKRMRGPAGED